MSTLAAKADPLRPLPEPDLAALRLTDRVAGGDAEWRDHAAAMTFPGGGAVLANRADNPRAVTITRNLRHLRVLLAVADRGSVTQASSLCHISQPAVTQAIGKLAREAGSSLFRRTPQGLSLTAAGGMLTERVRRAIDLLDPALIELSPRLRVTATAAQLQALIAVRETENFTLASRRLGIAQPTVHRAIAQLEREASRLLFERTSFGMIATRPTRALALAARLAFAELEQADADLAEIMGREVGRIVIGALPLARSYVLPRALAQFRLARPTLPVTVLDGPYDYLLSGLRHGDIDILIGALRDPAPIEDVEQILLFHDSLVLLGRRGHPLLGESAITLERLAAFPWVVARTGTPTRAQFDEIFSTLGAGRPRSIVKSGSIVLTRELLEASDHLGCVSRLQAAAELARGLLVVLPFRMNVADRPIGWTSRRGWNPTQAQRLLLDQLRQVRLPDAGV